jgi:hypothetical protein
MTPLSCFGFTLSAPVGSEEWKKNQSRVDRQWYLDLRDLPRQRPVVMPTPHGGSFQPAPRTARTTAPSKTESLERGTRLRSLASCCAARRSVDKAPEPSSPSSSLDRIEPASRLHHVLTDLSRAGSLVALARASRSKNTPRPSVERPRNTTDSHLLARSTDNSPIAEDRCRLGTW